MGYEVEMKFRVVDHGALAGRLARRGQLAGPPQVQDDYYIAHPSRDFSQSDEALRLRRHGENNILTYKGPRLGGPTKTREEIEIPLEDGPRTREQMITLLQRLGFGPVLEIRKTRLTYRLTYQGRPMVVALDRVEDLGAFAEVEALAVSEADLPAAQAAVQALAADLDLKEPESRSYLRMALQTLETQPAGPSGPV